MVVTVMSNLSKSSALFTRFCQHEPRNRFATWVHGVPNLRPQEGPQTRVKSADKGRFEQPNRETDSHDFSSLGPVRTVKGPSARWPHSICIFTDNKSRPTCEGALENFPGRIRTPKNKTGLAFRPISPVRFKNLNGC